MKNTKILVSSLLLLGATSLLASEAYSPLSYGVKSRGMGGVSIAAPLGAESGLANPALLSYLPQNEVSLGLTYMQSDMTLSGYPVSTDTENTYSPYLVSNYKLTKNFNIGAGISKYTLRNNFQDLLNLDYLESEIKKDRFVIPMSYALNNFSFGASVIYEKFSMTFDDTGTKENYDSSDFGYELGLAYNMKDTELIFGVDYKSKIEHKLAFDGYINSPSEIGLGINWHIAHSAHTVGVDYKRIFSSELVQGASVNITKDQDVYAIAYSYNANSWTVRAGYRYVSELYVDNDAGAVLNIIFPFSTTSHYTVGGSYTFSNAFSADCALVYATDKNRYNNFDGLIGDYREIESNPLSISLGFNYKY